MSKTVTEIVRRALVMTGRLALGSTPTSTLENDMIAAHDSVHGRLSRLDLAEWPLAGPVPDEYADDFAALIAAERAEGIPDARFQRVVLRASMAEKNIARVANGTYYVNPRPYTDY